MLASLNALLNDAAADLDRVRQQVVVADVNVLGENSFRASLAVDCRGLAYVRAAATLERYLKSTLGAVLAEIEARAVTIDQLRWSLFALVEHGELKKLQDHRKLSMWDVRIGIFARLALTTPVAFRMPALSLDGRTLTPDHFDRVWHLFGFSGAALPSARHGLALRDLARIRNDLAHGVSTPLEVARLKPTSDVTRMVGHVEDVVQHVALASDAYLSARAYLR